MTQVVTLSARVDSRAAQRLADDLRRLRGQPVALDAAGVQSLGALGVEVIVSAARQWQADGQALTLTGPSDAFAAVCLQLGLDAHAPWQPAVPAAEAVAA